MKIFNFELKEHHWPLLIGSSFTIAFFILVSYFVTVSAYNASHVIGQSYNSSEVFTTDYVNNGFPNEYGLYQPYDVEIDEINNRMFVADTGNNRVLVFGLDENNNLIDRVADYVIGQETLNSFGEGGVGAGVFDSPRTLDLDQAGGILFVTDFYNNRVLAFDVSTVENGQEATYVLGQSNFSSNTVAVTQIGMNQPTDVLFDENTHYLFVADGWSHRVLVFDLSNGIENGMAASYVLGQTVFNSLANGTAINKFSHPFGLSISNTDLFVSELGNNRVLVFSISTSTIENGMDANYVLGQSNFDSGSEGVDINRMNRPIGLDVSSSSLFVVDDYNNRVLVFDLPIIENGQEATYVLGQDDFISNVSGHGQDSFYYPNNVKYYNNQLYVGDRANNRISIFDITNIENGQSAVDLLGQLDENNEPVFSQYYSNNTGPNDSGFGGLEGMLLDEKNHRLFVSDEYNNRVLVFAMDETNELLDYVADNVLGQDSFETNGSAISTSSFYGPREMEYDEENDYLFVSDFWNNRVLVFDLSNGIEDGMNASYVLGQSDFISSGKRTLQNSLYYPQGLFFNSASGTLYVSDSANYRVLMFDLSEGITNGMNAIDVWGQSDFVTRNTGSIIASTINGPRGLTFDNSRGYLFVSDYYNNRVLVFDINSESKDALYVLGQDDFITGTAITTQDGMSTPRGIIFDDEHDRLFVVDNGNYRTLIFDVSEIENGENATMVLGQNSYTSYSTSNKTASGPSSGHSFVFDNINDHHRLYVPSVGSRILIFDFIKVSSGSLTAGVVGEAYSQTITSNSQGTVTSEIVSGSLPPGLTLSGSTISGTPTDFGTYTFTVHATDTLSTGNFWDEEEMTIEVSQNLTDWSYRKKITIDADQVDADLTDFPVLVSFSADTNLATSASSTGADIIFVGSDVEWGSGTAGDRYDFEIEKYDSTTGELVAWVKIPELSSSIDTDIYLYYGNDSVSQDLQSTDTWNSNFKMVQHLEEDCNEADCIVDDSGNGHVGSPYEKNTAETPAVLKNLYIQNGKIGGAQNFDATDHDYININNSEDFNLATTSHSFSAWFSESVTSSIIAPIIFRFSGGTPGEGYYLSSGNGGLVTMNRTELNDPQILIQRMEDSHNLNVWHHAVVTVDLEGGVAKLYVDGEEVGSDTNFGTLRDDTINPLAIGGRTSMYSFDGQIDEVRINHSALSAEWISTEYTNQNNPEDFYSISPQETQNGNSLSGWTYRKKITIDADQVAGDLNDFTLLVSFDSDSDLVSHVASSTGGDIIFVPSSEDWASGNTNNRYSFTISSFDSVSGTLSALVKIPELSSSEDTEFYMYYGNSDATVLQDSDHTEISGSGDDWTTTYNNNRNYPADFYIVSPELISSGTALSGWNYRKKITVESNYVAGDLTEFPVHINLSSDADLSAKANEDGSDILLVPASFDWTSDDTNDRYQFEIISYTSSTGALEAYVNIPVLSDSTDTEFYIYYNNTSQTTSLEDTNTQNGSSTTTQALATWTQTVSNNDNEEVNFYSLSDEEFYNQDAYHLTITGTESMIPSGSQIITISLVDNSSDPALLYDGDKTVVFSGAHADIDGNQPTCTNKDSEDINFGSDTVITFTDGVGVCVLKLYKEESVSVDAVAGVFSTTGGSFHDLDIAVSTEQQPTVSGGGGSGVGIRQGGTFKINDGSAIVSSKFITLYMSPGSGVKSMAVANDESFSGVSVGEYKEAVDWVLEGEEGLKKVYVKFWYDDGKTSGALSISVVLDTKPKIISPAKDEEILQTPFTIEGTANAGNKVEVKIAGTTYTVKADENGKYSVVVLDQLTAGEYDISVRQIDRDASKGQILTRKIRVGKKIEKVKVEEDEVKDKVEPIKEDVGVDTLPVNEMVDSTPKIEVVDVVIESPTTEKLQAEVQEVAKKDAFLLVMQTDSVGFYKTQIDGIETVGGDSVEILIRPKNELHSVVGRLYSTLGGEEKVSWFDRIKRLFVEPAYAENVLDKPDMVDSYLFEFDEQYNVFRTNIVTPKNNGNEYELVISMNGEDGSRVDLSKQVRTAHKGAIKSNQREVSYSRIEIFRQNEESGKYEKWNADLYGGKNPLFTEEDGRYALQVPAGAYYLEVAAPGYEIYHSKIHVFSEPSVINDDLEMIEGPYSWWFRFWEWVKRQTK